MKELKCIPMDLCMKELEFLNPMKGLQCVLWYEGVGVCPSEPRYEGVGVCPSRPFCEGIGLRAGSTAGSQFYQYVPSTVRSFLENIYIIILHI